MTPTRCTTFSLRGGGFDDVGDRHWMRPDVLSNMIVTNFDEP